MDDIKVTPLEDREPLPSGADVLPDLADLPVEAAVRLLMSHGLDAADARFRVALAHGEIEGDAVPSAPSDTAQVTGRHDRSSA